MSGRLSGSKGITFYNPDPPPKDTRATDRMPVTFVKEHLDWLRQVAKDLNLTYKGVPSVSLALRQLLDNHIPQQIKEPSVDPLVRKKAK